MLVASLEWTAYLALAMVVTAVPMGLMAAKFYKRTRHKIWFVTLMLLPLFVPADIMASSLLVYFKQLNGLFEWLGEALGIAGPAGSSSASRRRLSARPSIPCLTRSSSSSSPCRAIASNRPRRRGAAGPPPGRRSGRWSSRRSGSASSAPAPFVVILSFNEAPRTALLKGGFDTFANVLVSQMMNVGMSEESYAMAGTMSIISMIVIGSILVYTMLKAERLERVARAKAQPLMSQ